MKLVFLLEEPSMKYLLAGLLPRILPENVDVQLIPHNGKQDLRKSIPRKLKAWTHTDDIRFVILHDQDNKDCTELKKELLCLCNGANRPVLVRIACQELEAWYFGDMEAVAEAYGNPKLKRLSNRKQYRIPDGIPDPKKELYKLIPELQQIEGAKKIAPHMDIERNRSVSFQAFVSGVRRLVVEPSCG